MHQKTHRAIRSNGFCLVVGYLDYRPYQRDSEQTGALLSSKQQINAFDGQRAGAGITSDSFDFSKFIQYLPHHQYIKDNFRNWQHQTPALFLNELESVIQPKIQESYRFNRPSIKKSIFRKKLPNWQ